MGAYGEGGAVFYTTKMLVHEMYIMQSHLNE